MPRTSNQLIISVVVGTLVIVTAILLILVILRSSEKKPTSTTGPTITPIPTKIQQGIPGNPTGIQQSPEYVRSFEEISSKEAEFYKREATVGQLLPKLPYQGTNFSFSYSYKTGEFSAVISNTQRDQGDKEFDSFLLTNGVQSRSWIRNLTISYN